MNPEQEQAQPRWRRAALVGAVAAMLAVAGCGKGAAQDDHAGEGDKHAEHSGEKEGGHSGNEELVLTTEEATRAGIKVEAVQPQALADTVTVTATIRPDQERLAHVAPRIEGRVASAPAKLGDKVRAGQVLATLDSVAVGEAHAQWVQAQSDLRVAERNLERAKALDADEIIPRKDFLSAQAEREKAAAAQRAAAERLRLLGGTAKVGGNAAGFTVTAPFAGTVIEKKAVLGELAAPSEPMFAIADLGTVWIQADLSEALLAKVRVGASAKVSVPAYPGETFTGKVGHIAAMLDKETRTVAARIEVANADGRLKPEMFATAVIEVGGSDKREAIALPDAAIVLMQGQPTVFVYEQGAYAMRVVEPGERLAGRTVVKSGLVAGDEVVTAGAYALKARKLKSSVGHGH